MSSLTHFFFIRQRFEIISFVVTRSRFNLSDGKKPLHCKKKTPFLSKEAAKEELSEIIGKKNLESLSLYLFVWLRERREKIMIDSLQYTVVLSFGIMMSRITKYFFKLGNIIDYILITESQNLGTVVIRTGIDQGFTIGAQSIIFIELHQKFRRQYDNVWRWCKTREKRYLL